jgi:HrpA-like RNA helicase
LRSLTSFDYSILKRTTHIIIDEIHERDRQTEFLLACLRDLGREFPHLKLILMGADMDIDLMTSYFGGEANCPLIEVKGRLFPVKIFFLEDVLSLIQYEVDPRNRRFQNQGGPTTDVNLEELRLSRYQNAVDPDRVDLQLIVKLLYYVHINNEFQEAVLIFLPGYEEIVTLKQMIFCDPDLGNLSNEIVVFLLHSNIQTGDQRAVFERPRNGARRKIVLSTNIAETSLTIEDIVYVIDAGKVKEKTIDSFTGVTQLKSNWISQASANQRQGRAGRCRPGTIIYDMIKNI